LALVVAVLFAFFSSFICLVGGGEEGGEDEVDARGRSEEESENEDVASWCCSPNSEDQLPCKISLDKSSRSTSMCRHS